MIIEKTPLESLLIIKPNFYKDDRGDFFEVWRETQHRDLGLTTAFVQDNQSRSNKNVLRGLHYQRHFPQGQLVWVSEGKVFDVCVDLRRNSETFLQWFSIELGSEEATMLYMPPGFAHGFYVLSEVATMHYKCTDYYNHVDETGIVWSDPQLAIPWPTSSPILSQRDSQFQTIAQQIETI